MLTVVVELATALPAVWIDLFDDDDGAAQELSKLRQKRQRLAGEVECSLEAAQQRAIRLNKPDPWLEASVADLRCLTSTKPDRVASAYRTAVEGLQSFNLDSVRRQLELYRRLKLLTANVDAALALPEWGSSAAPNVVLAPPRSCPRHCVHRPPHRQSNAPGASFSAGQRNRCPGPNSREALATPRADQGSGRPGTGGRSERRRHPVS